jgi:hypothetical protein
MFKNKKVLSLSHNDLDGISCQMLLLDFVKSPLLYQCDYMGTLEQLKFIKIYMHEFDILLVTDLVLTEDVHSYVEQLSVIYPKLTIIWIDHHFQSVSQGISKSNNIKIIVDTEQSATKILWDMLSGGVVPEYVAAVNAFDIWLTEDKYFNMGMMYNSLFWNYKGKSYFNQFRNTRALSPKNLKDYNNILRTKKEYFNDLKSKGLVLEKNNIVVIFGDLYQNWTQLDFPAKFNLQVFSFGKILLKIDKSVPEDLCVQLSNEILSSVNNDLLINAGGHHHILSLSHSGNNDYSIIIDYTKVIFNILSNYK